jgi:hypothetical protein
VRRRAGGQGLPMTRTAGPSTIDSWLLSRQLERAISRAEAGVKKRGLVLRYRKSYFALADLADSATEADYALQAALWSPVDATTLGIQAKIQTIDLGTREMDLRVNVDASQLLLGEADGHRTGNIHAIYLQLAPGDVVVAADPLTYKVDVSEKDYQAIVDRGCELKAHQRFRVTCGFVLASAGDVVVP